ncbi:MAG: hypothetical protein FWD49_00660 [Firmicutes bacterium]|nr:hypothetical protein [Bacillota bacterium]
MSLREILNQAKEQNRITLTNMFSMLDKADGIMQKAKQFIASSTKDNAEMTKEQANMEANRCMDVAREIGELDQVFKQYNMLNMSPKAGFPKEKEYSKKAMKKKFKEFFKSRGIKFGYDVANATASITKRQSALQTGMYRCKDADTLK